MDMWRTQRKTDEGTVARARDDLHDCRIQWHANPICDHLKDIGIREAVRDSRSLTVALGRNVLVDGQLEFVNDFGQNRRQGPGELSSDYLDMVGIIDTLRPQAVSQVNEL